jgi:hypothetical protein
MSTIIRYPSEKFLLKIVSKRKKKMKIVDVSGTPTTYGGERIFAGKCVCAGK